MLCRRTPRSPPTRGSTSGGTAVSRPTPGVERVAERSREHGADAPFRVRERERRSHLALDLALADDHRVQARGDAQQVTDGAVVAVRIARGFELATTDAAVLDEGAAQR